MRVALAHDYLYTLGGAERTVAVLRGLWPDAPVFTSFVDYGAFPDLPHSPLDVAAWDVRASFLQRLPQPARWQKLLTPIYPLAFRGFDVAPYDVVVSSASFAAKGIPRRPNTLHVSYCYTPPRFLWGLAPATDRQDLPWLLRGLDALLRPPLRRWDRWAAAQPHHLVAISQTVADRIRRIYGRESTVIYPPVATRRFRCDRLSANGAQPGRDAEYYTDEGYYVFVGRLEAHKRVELAIAAARETQVPLRVVGDGPLRESLARTAPPNVQILGWQSEQELAAHLAGCRALVFPGEEDFGIVMVEALSAGKPVIAYGAGGATEIVRPGVNGVLVPEQSAAAFAQALRQFDPDEYPPEACRETAARFDEEVFAGRFKEFVEEKWAEFKQRSARNANK